jgi:hypothetical protein
VLLGIIDFPFFCEVPIRISVVLPDRLPVRRRIYDDHPAGRTSISHSGSMSCPHSHWILPQSICRTRLLSLNSDTVAIALSPSLYQPLMIPICPSGALQYPSNSLRISLALWSESFSGGKPFNTHSQK